MPGIRPDGSFYGGISPLPAPSSWTAQGGYALWMKPVSPTVDDVEFESTTMPSGWSDVGTDDGNIDVYSTLATASHKRQSFHTNCRPSWYMCQPTSNANFVGIMRSYTPPTNVLIWARLSMNSTASASIADNDRSAALALLPAAAAGVPGNDSIQMYINESDSNTFQAQVLVVEGGSTSLTAVTEDSAVTNSFPLQPEYIAIHKISTTYHFWCGTTNGGWYWMGSRAYAGVAVDTLCLIGTNAAATNPAPKVWGCDFIRFQTQATLLP